MNSQKDELDQRRSKMYVQPLKMVVLLDVSDVQLRVEILESRYEILVLEERSSIYTQNQSLHLTSRLIADIGLMEYWIPRRKPWHIVEKFEQGM